MMRSAGSLRPAAAPLTSEARSQSKGPPKASRALVDGSFAWTRSSVATTSNARKVSPRQERPRSTAETKVPGRRAAGVQEGGRSRAGRNARHHDVAGERFIGRARDLRIEALGAGRFSQAFGRGRTSRIADHPPQAGQDLAQRGEVAVRLRAAADEPDRFAVLARQVFRRQRRHGSRADDGEHVAVEDRRRNAGREIAQDHEPVDAGETSRGILRRNSDPFRRREG